MRGAPYSTHLEQPKAPKVRRQHRNLVEIQDELRQRRADQDPLRNVLQMLPLEIEPLRGSNEV